MIENLYSMKHLGSHEVFLIDNQLNIKYQIWESRSSPWLSRTKHISGVKSPCCICQGQIQDPVTNIICHISNIKYQVSFQPYFPSLRLITPLILESHPSLISPIKDPIFDKINTHCKISCQIHGLHKGNS